MKRPGIRIERVPYEPPGGVSEFLRYELSVFDESGNLLEVLGRLADLDVALAAFDAAVAKHPGKRIFLRDRARVIRRSDRSE